MVDVPQVDGDHLYCRQCIAPLPFSVTGQLFGAHGDIRAALKKAPEVPPSNADTTKQEALRRLAREIQALQKRDNLLEQVAAMFRNGGLVLTTPTLKSYPSRPKRAGGEGAGPDRAFLGMGQTVTCVRSRDPPHRHASESNSDGRGSIYERAVPELA